MKKLPKSQEETSIENFSPVIKEGDAKITTEKIVRPEITQMEMPKKTTEKTVQPSTPKEEILKTAVEKQYPKKKSSAEIETIEKIPDKKNSKFKKTNGKNFKRKNQGQGNRYTKLC